MVDRCSPDKRRAIMASIGAKNTRPETLVRRLVHRMGYRFRLHRRDLPGTPHLVLPRHRPVVFVHGCFWHQHTCLGGRLPTSNQAYWHRKLARNLARDVTARRALRALEWRVLTIWECQIAAPGLEDEVEQFLRGTVEMRSRADNSD